MKSPFTPARNLSWAAAALLAAGTMIAPGYGSAAGSVPAGQAVTAMAGE
jgi:hypothetical protein